MALDSEVATVRKPLGSRSPPLFLVLFFVFIGGGGVFFFLILVAEVVEAVVGEKVEAAIKTMLSADQINEALVRKISTDTLTQLETVQNLDALPAKRLVTFQNRGMAVATKVGCISEQISAALVACYKAYAVEAGDLIPLPGENEMCDARADCKQGVVDAALLNHTNTARRWAATVLKASECQNAESMKVGSGFSKHGK